MKTSLYIILAVIIFLAYNNSYSQGLSLYGGGGFNFPIAKRLNVSLYPNNTIEFVKTGYSKGITVNGGISYFIFENIGVDFNISYLFTGEKGLSGTRGEETEYFKNTNLSFVPSIILQTKIKQVTPYAKFGFSINFIKVNLYDNDNEYPSYKYTSDYTFGVNASLGIKLEIEKHFSIFTEARLASFTFYADKVVYTWEFNGERHSEEYELTDKFPDNGFGGLEAIRDFPFSSFNISVGFVFSL